jgi:hypothetical protein
MGWSVRLLPAAEEAIAHIGGTTRARHYPAAK